MSGRFFTGTDGIAVVGVGGACGVGLAGASVAVMLGPDDDIPGLSLSGIVEPGTGAAFSLLPGATDVLANCKVIQIQITLHFKQIGLTIRLGDYVLLAPVKYNRSTERYPSAPSFKTVHLI